MKLARSTKLSILQMILLLWILPLSWAMNSDNWEYVEPILLFAGGAISTLTIVILQFVKMIIYLGEMEDMVGGEQYHDRLGGQQAPNEGKKR